MARRPSYRTQLQHPEFQKVRLEVLERDGWRCRWCETGNVNLQVHHGYYKKNAEPWDYERESLWSLCKNCHVRAENVRRDVYRVLGHVHPKHHAHILNLLEQVRSLVESDEHLLQEAEVTRA